MCVLDKEGPKVKSHLRLKITRFLYGIFTLNFFLVGKDRELCKDIEITYNCAFSEVCVFEKYSRVYKTTSTSTIYTYNTIYILFTENKTL